MKKDQALTLLQIVEDCTDVIAKEIEAGLKPNYNIVIGMSMSDEEFLERKKEAWKIYITQKEEEENE